MLGVSHSKALYIVHCMWMSLHFSMSGVGGVAVCSLKFGWLGQQTYSIGVPAMNPLLDPQSIINNSPTP